MSPFTGAIADESALSEGFAPNLVMPEGYYLFGFRKVRPSAETADKPIHFYDLVVEGGPPNAPIGAAFTHFGLFATPDAPDKKMSWTWGRLLRSAGVNPEPIMKTDLRSYAKFAALATMLTNVLAGKKKVGGTVVNEERNGNIRSSVLEFWSASEWENRKNTPVSSGVSTSSNGAAPAAGASDEEIGDALAGLLSEERASV